MDKKGYRLNVLLPSEYREKLDIMTEKTGMTKVSLVAFAISQYIDVYEAQQAVLESMKQNPAQFVGLIGGAEDGRHRQS